MTDLEELLGYVWLKPKVTGLTVDLFADDGQAFERDGHEPWVYVRNGYDRFTSDFIAITIEGQRLVGSAAELKIRANELEDVRRFVNQHRALLLDSANGLLSPMEFFKRLDDNA